MAHTMATGASTAWRIALQHKACYAHRPQSANHGGITANNSTTTVSAWLLAVTLGWAITGPSLPWIPSPRRTTR